MLTLYGGKAWWDAADRDHAASIFAPLPIVTSVSEGVGGRRSVEVLIDDDEFRRGRWSAIVPDHGKLMHAFLIREPGLDAFFPAPGPSRIWMQLKSEGTVYTGVFAVDVAASE